MNWDRSVCHHSGAEPCTEGYRYVVLSLYFWKAALPNPVRNAENVGIYSKLFREGRLLAEFPWSPYHGESTVLVYELECDPPLPPHGR